VLVLACALLLPSGRPMLESSASLPPTRPSPPAWPLRSRRLRPGRLRYYFEHGIEMKSGVTLRGETGDPTCVVIDGGAPANLRCSGVSAATRIEDDLPQWFTTGPPPAVRRRRALHRWSGTHHRDCVSIRIWPRRGLRSGRGPRNLPVLSVIQNSIFGVTCRAGGGRLSAVARQIRGCLFTGNSAPSREPGCGR